MGNLTEIQKKKKKNIFRRRQSETKLYNDGLGNTGFGVIIYFPSDFYY